MKHARLRKRITFRKLSEQTGIKISRLCSLEKGRAEPTSEEVDKIALVLGSNIKFADSDTVKKNKEDFENMTKVINKVFNEIKSRGFGKGNGGHGKMECPKCNADLYFSVTSSNGHAQIKCSSEKCLAWIQ